MDKSRQLVLLLGLLCCASYAHAGGPLLHEVVPSLGAMAGGRGGAKIMSNNYREAVRHTLDFAITSFGNCASYGCQNSYVNCGGGTCSSCPISHAYAETKLTCQKNEQYGYHNDGYNHDEKNPPFIGEAMAGFNDAGSCSWEIKKFTGGGEVTEADGVTKRRGSVRGTCTLPESSENCNSEGKSSGPLCGGMVITIDAWYFWYRNAWWKSDRDTIVANDNKWCDYDSDCEDSCCMLDWDLGFISAPNCDGRRRSANGTQPVDAANLPPTKAQESPAGAGRRLQAANYDHQYNGPYRYGTAIVVWGTFYAANTATGEKWEDEGIAQWVVQNYEWGTGNGVPPSDRIFLEANSLSLQFTKEEKEGYGYRDAMQN